MNAKRLLLLSNSTNVGMGYLEHAKPHIAKYLGKEIFKVAFVPFAGITITRENYVKRVSDAFAQIGYEIFSLHLESDPIKALEKADAIAVGGGNTFKLVHDLYKTGLMSAIAQKVNEGLPFIGWSAGSNVACPSLRTTNDMPVIEPPSFTTMNIVPFQINPHYLDAHPEGHGGETRQQRLEEFLELNPGTWVVGLREGTILRVEGDKVQLIGDRPARIFKKGIEYYELDNTGDFSFLMK
jgi:dipeptidase E